MMSWPSCTITVTLAQEMGLAKLNCISSKKPPSTYFFLKGVYFRITCLVQCGLLAYFHRGKFFARGNKINLCLDLVSHKISLQMLSLKKKKVKCLSTSWKIGLIYLWTTLNAYSF